MTTKVNFCDIFKDLGCIELARACVRQASEESLDVNYVIYLEIDISERDKADKV